MSRKKRFTLEEHRDVGRRLSATRDEFMELYVLIANAYPRATRQVKLMHRVYESLDIIRSDMEREAFNEHVEATICLYYPHHSGPHPCHHCGYRPEMEKRRSQ